MRQDEVDDGRGEDKVGELPELEVAEEADVPVLVLDVTVGHRDPTVAPVGHRQRGGQLERPPDPVVDDRLVKVHLRLRHAAELGEAVPLEEREGGDRHDGAEERRDEGVADEVGRRLGEVGVLQLLDAVEKYLDLRSFNGPI